jgi:hypothetical protein
MVNNIYQASACGGGVLKINAYPLDQEDKAEPLDTDIDVG